MALIINSSSMIDPTFKHRESFGKAKKSKMMATLAEVQKQNQSVMGKALVQQSLIY